MDKIVPFEFSRKLENNSCEYGEEILGEIVSTDFFFWNKFLLQILKEPTLLMKICYMNQQKVWSYKIYVH